MESVTTFEAKTRFGRRNLESVRKAVAELVGLSKEIAARNKGKPKLTSAEVKSWIEEGRH